ncbi:DUF4352 domain-containing protein [Nonomuraea sp. NPDC050394]|uniref:DUF4352 domain-containing protein n=1 Tax=Nonomuraea sp. NPDC050394 TaxID=3364363 RepID=UPI0037A19E78
MNGYGYPLPQPPKKSRAPLYALLFVVVLVIGVVGTVSVIAMNRAAKNAAYEETTRNGTIGTAVRDGDLSFTVTTVERKDRVGDTYIGKDAQGEFLIVHLRVLNLGKRSGSFAASSQKLVVGGREYRPSTSAAIYLKDSGAKLLFERIGAGHFVEGVLVFDVPKSATDLTLELRDSAINKGAKVTLS